jgi:hypothetical protein
VALSTEQRSLRGRIGAFALHAKYDSRELTKAARAKFDERFLDEVDPNRELPEPERRRRASYARQRYFAALAYRSAKVRAARRKAGSK